MKDILDELKARAAKRAEKTEAKKKIPKAASSTKLLWLTIAMNLLAN